MRIEVLMSIAAVLLTAGALYLGIKIGPGFSVPNSISDDAQKAFVERFNTLESRAGRALISLPEIDDKDAWRELQAQANQGVKSFNQLAINNFQPEIVPVEFDGVKALDIKPRDWKDNGKLLIYLHGGAYVFYSAETTLLSSVSMAAETGLRVISVDYTLAPHADFTQIQEEVVTVVRGLLAQGYSMDDIAMYGDSAGGGLTAAMALKLRDLNIGMPKALVLWSPWTDVTGTGDSYDTLKDDEPTYLYEALLKPSALAYAPASELKNPYVSPVYGDFSKGYPPTLIQAGTKELFLSDAVRFYQAVDNAGQIVKLDIHEGMWHVFQIHIGMPEADLARAKAANFIREHLM